MPINPNDKKFVIGRFANMLVYFPFLASSILIKHFTDKINMIKFFELSFKISNKTDSFEIISVDHSFDFLGENSKLVEQTLYDFYLTKMFINKLIKKSKEDKLKILIPVTINFGKDKNMNHQCFLIIDIKDKNIKYFDPYGKLIMFGIDYEPTIKEIVKDLFSDHPDLKYEESNIANNAQTIILKNNNLKFESGIFIEDLKKLNLPTSVEKRLIKNNIDDEKDKTIASLKLLENRTYLEIIDSSKTNNDIANNFKKYNEFFYNYSSKTCVSLSLIILHQYFYDVVKTNDLFYLENFLSETDIKFLLDPALTNKQILNLMILKNL